MARGCRFTIRCGRDDLPNLPSGIAEGLRRKVENRIALRALETGDRYLSVPVPRMYTEHQGDFRAITWFDDTHDVVWICAVGYHYPERDESRDLYKVAARLHEADRLLPTVADYTAAEAEELVEEVERFKEDAARLRQIAKTSVVEAALRGARFEVRNLGDGLYELTVPQATSLGTILILVGALFPDQIETEWAEPEPGSDGTLYQTLVVLVPE